MSDYLKRPEPASPLAEVDREAAIFSWLEQHHVPNAWEIAPVIAETSIPLSFLDEFAARFPDEVTAPAMATLASSLRVERMAETVVNSTVRIFDFISAIKDYSYMDQAPIQEIDVAHSLDRTLTMFGSRLTGITIERDYDPELPHISAYGSELNQVWTALIDNALDAMRSPDGPAPSVSPPAPRRHGLRRNLATPAPASRPKAQSASSSPSSPPSPSARASASASTPSSASSSKHSGSVTVQSAEGATCFRVQVPIERAGAY